MVSVVSGQRDRGNPEQPQCNEEEVMEKSPQSTFEYKSLVTVIVCRIKERAGIAIRLGKASLASITLYSLHIVN